MRRIQLIKPECSTNRNSNGNTGLKMAMESPTALNSVCETQPTKLERVFCMQGGNGDTSYAKNSQGQAKHLQSLRPLLEEALNNMDLPASETLTIVDLGCSSGQNTLVIANVIVNCLMNKYKLASLNMPDFQVFFSDLPSNDFNTLFQLLPVPMEVPASRTYYAAGVPGSFYKRLFPRNTLNVVHSSFSLHWLSQVPDVVLDPNSSAWNKGRVFIHSGSNETANAYRLQFKSDFEDFLRARSEEMKSGGCMFLVCLGRTFQDPTNQGGGGILFGTHFEHAWNDLVEEGMVEAERRDSFNVPFFAPTVAEVREVVEKESSFTVNKVDVFKGGSPLVVESAENNEELARAFTNQCRSVCGVLVDNHIGKDLSTELFSRMEKRATEHARALVHDLQFFHVVAALTRM
ncbi:indole-3-acetate O-methyltransferase 1 isoform X1 [Cryptomeria japonica]|uniref:indole-3-acetate O-methyltransferase 1 isoform X1 n=2 Tax=Cryptomeria japonica TaxID=3369 RepID=UPI0027DA5AF2|nr:indole-3-acetate O-methyltransferase 1 isoform X1 [Cryptomeria japonica]